MLSDWNFYNHSFDELLSELQDRIIKERKTFLVTANPVIFMEGQRDPHYNEIVTKADYITPDGIGIVKACHWLKRPVQSRITGFDLMRQLLELGNQKGWTIYLLGAKPEVVSLTNKNIKKMYPNLSITGFHHGYFDDDETIVNEILVTKPDLIFVAMGCPRQEKWIYDHLPIFQKGVFMGVGGSFNVLAGIEDRAPKQWIHFHLEWLYRIIKKPQRIGLLFILFLFLFQVSKEYLQLNLVKSHRNVIEKKG
ncbi:MAG: WecB/TagA/CpsF family glycosyltransferase [Bacillus sp. (in: firmicutes)]